MTRCPACRGRRGSDGTHSTGHAATRRSAMATGYMIGVVLANYARARRPLRLRGGGRIVTKCHDGSPA